MENNSDQKIILSPYIPELRKKYDFHFRCYGCRTISYGTVQYQYTCNNFGMFTIEDNFGYPMIVANHDNKYYCPYCTPSLIGQPKVCHKLNGYYQNARIIQKCWKKYKIQKQKNSLLSKLLIVYENTRMYIIPREIIYHISTFLYSGIK